MRRTLLTGIADVGGIYATRVGGTFDGKGGTRTQFDGILQFSAQVSF
jgi:hypothetical protein